MWNMLRVSAKYVSGSIWRASVDAARFLARNLGRGIRFADFRSDLRQERVLGGVLLINDRSACAAESHA
jgi:hypothetical protein